MSIPWNSECRIGDIPKIGLITSSPTSLALTAEIRLNAVGMRLAASSGSGKT
jgi:hypothetical protein